MSPLASHLVVGFGAAVCIMILAAQASNAEGWSRSSAKLDWSRQDRFSGNGEIAERPIVERVAFVRTVTQSSGTELERLMDLIGRAEAPAGYNAVQYNAKIKPPKPASQMTLGEIATWIRKTPGQPHAIGRYQVIPKTLGRVTAALGMKASTLYDRATQDRIGLYLINEAGYSEFRSGKITLSGFMDRLAKVWAAIKCVLYRATWQKVDLERLAFNLRNGNAFRV